MEVNPEGDEDQEYVWPTMAVAPMVVLLPEQTFLEAPTVARGSAFTVTVILLDLIHPLLFVSVSV